MKCAATHQAIDKADKIVAAHAGESNFEKLQSYRKEICALTDYNDAAANAANNTPYGDPWQLIYVFDNDPDTKVVCEGYSKAFQLLCDLTKFDQAIDCITVSGNMSGGTGSGGHMWNVVTMEDGKHYIVDVTNCDARTVGYPDLLFLSGAAEGGSVSGGYRVDCNNTTITYTYDATTRFLFTDGELTLSTDAYTPAAAKVYGCTLSLEGDIAINFYLVLPDEILSDSGAYVMLNDTKMMLTAAKTVKQGDLTLYGFKYRVTAKEMGEEVTLHAYNGTGVLLPLLRNSNNENLTETGFTYSVRQYIQQAVDSNSNAKLVALAKAMSDYGGKAQKRFNYDTANIADPYNPEAIAKVTTEDVEPYMCVKTLTDRTGIEFAFMSLTLKSETTMNLYFTLSEGETIDDYTFTVDGKTAKPIYTSIGYKIKVPNISAKNLDEFYKVEVCDEQGVCLTVDCTALHYAYLVLSDGTQSEALTELVQALYLYNQAANVYFNKK